MKAVLVQTHTGYTRSSMEAMAFCKAVFCVTRRSLVITSTSTSSMERVSWKRSTTSCSLSASGQWLYSSFDRGQCPHWLYSRRVQRSEEHTSELQSLMRISYDVFCLKKNNKTNQ